MQQPLLYLMFLYEGNQQLQLQDEGQRNRPTMYVSLEHYIIIIVWNCKQSKWRKVQPKCYISITQNSDLATDIPTERLPKDQNSEISFFVAHGHTTPIKPKCFSARKWKVYFKCENCNINQELNIWELQCMCRTGDQKVYFNPSEARWEGAERLKALW
jgi:hypothetical protein